MHVKSLQSCPTLCDPIDGSPPGSSVHGIFQARVLEWVAISFSILNCRWILYQLSHKKNPPSNAGDPRAVSSIPGSGRYPGAGNGNPLQYCCLENPMARGAWWATVHGVAKSWTRLSMHAKSKPQLVSHGMWLCWTYFT